MSVSLPGGNAALPRTGRRGGLPAAPGPLLGRDHELALLAALLTEPEIRLVTLTGPPGVGKTRLALAAAAGDRSRDDVAVVDLTPVRDPHLVLGEIAATLAPAGPAGDAIERLARSTGDRRLLLVLDNLEHVLAAAPALAEFLAAAPGLTVLATSRERLRLRIEHEVPVPPLGLPGPAELADPDRFAATPAVALLVERVRAFDPGFAVTAANRSAVAAICVRLDGLPLALELAAPRLRLFNPAELLFRLRHRVGTLAADAVDVPDRHRTLTSALAWSHDLLGPADRATFRRLSVFVGGWTLEAAGQVCLVDDPVATTASLVDKSLVRRVGSPGEAARFGMLESLREFAGEQLDRSGELTGTRDRHADFFAGRARTIERRVGTADERAAIEEVGLDVGNMRQALQHDLAGGRPAHALPIATALGWHAYTRGLLGIGQATLESVIDAVAGSAEVEPEDLAGALLMVGAIALARGDVGIAERRLLAGLAVNETAGSLRLQANGTAFLGHLARARERPTEAVARHEEAGRLHERVGNVAGVAWSRYDLGLLARRRRQADRAAGLLRESLGAFRDLRYDWAIGYSAWALAAVEASRSRGREAAALLLEALTAFGASHDDRGMAQCLECAATVVSARGDARTAACLLGVAAALRDRLAAPLPAEEQGAVGAVRLRTRHDLGADGQADAERAGRALRRDDALALARTALAQPPVPRPRDPAGTSVEALTPRECEVAGLVRQGCTNRQIGRRLGISEKTIEVHVHHIIGKLRAGSRAEVAAWVAAREVPGATGATGAPGRTP